MGNDFTLQRNSTLPACPPVIPILVDTLQQAVIAFQQSENQWFTTTITALRKTTFYNDYRTLVDLATGANTLLQTWQARESRNNNLNKLRYFVRQDWIGAKINRFSHAMDPDRGVLTFISFVFSDDYEIYGIYALVRPKGGDILKQDLIDLDMLKAKFVVALEKDKGGVPTWFTNELEKVITSATHLSQVIDFQPIWERHKSKIADNKVIATIAYFLDGLYLNHNGIKLVWDRRKLLGSSEAVFLKVLESFFRFNTYTAPAPIIEESSEVDEDEVTYSIVHKVLIPNQFRIVSISYPGAQGGGAILTNPELGKAQPREYPDIIALPPIKTAGMDVILNESKGMFSKSSVEKDTDKILRYKKDTKLQAALKDTLVVAKVIDAQEQVKNITIGIAFGVKSNTPTLWKPDEVDFIFRITERKKWAIGIFNQTLRDLIPIIEGNTTFPTVFKIKK